ncbi:MAG TPA: 30S ribosomal protein S6 [Blastocatellia bacterium]|nr:30S ribosomal protein S6 [Blastocatellia bacterium]
MRTYEVLFIVAPNVEESDVDPLITQLTEVLTNQGATVVKTDRMGRRRLAYPIHKFTDGHYVVLTVEGTGSELAELERRMRVTDSIIRYLTVRIDEDLKRAEKFRVRRAARAASGRSSSRGRGRAAETRGGPREEGEEQE